MRKKAGTDNEVSALIDSDVSRKAFRKNWAGLIYKIYNVDPLLLYWRVREWDVRAERA